MRFPIALAFWIGAAVLSPLSLMAKPDLPVDPRLDSYIEGLPVELRDSFWSFLERLPIDEREISIRFLLWSEFLDGQNDAMEFGALLSAMAERVDGCLLPEKDCEELSISLYGIRLDSSVAQSTFLLSTAMAKMNSIADCQLGRRGFIDGYSIEIGESNIVLMTTTNEDSSTCFVRELGAG